MHCKKVSGVRIISVLAAAYLVMAPQLELRFLLNLVFQLSKQKIPIHQQISPEAVAGQLFNYIIQTMNT